VHQYIASSVSGGLQSSFGKHFLERCTAVLSQTSEWPAYQPNNGQLFIFFLLLRTHVSMVTSEHMNQLLKNVLNLIKKNIGNENAPWMTRIAGKPL